jgi:hypothetical protein
VIHVCSDEHNGEDLEQYAGEEIPDPWDDELQDDWPISDPIEVEV